MKSTVIHICSLVLIGVGFFSMVAGLVILIRRAFSTELKDVEKEAARLAKKGLLTEMSGTMESASFLIKEMTEMLSTVRGIGMLLIFIGTVFVGAGIALIYRLG